MQIPYHKHALLQRFRLFAPPSFVQLAQDLHLVFVENGPRTGRAAHPAWPGPALMKQAASLDKRAAL
jgi:hypothetical protein